MQQPLRRARAALAEVLVPAVALDVAQELEQAPLDPDVVPLGGAHRSVEDLEILRLQPTCRLVTSERPLLQEVLEICDGTPEDRTLDGRRLRHDFPSPFLYPSPRVGRPCAALDSRVGCGARGPRAILKATRRRGDPGERVRRPVLEEAAG